MNNMRKIIGLTFIKIMI